MMPCITSSSAGRDLGALMLRNSKNEDKVVSADRYVKVVRSDVAKS